MQSLRQKVSGAIGNDLIQIIAVVGLIALFGAGVVLSLDAMADAVPADEGASHNFEAHQPANNTVNGIGAGGVLVTVDNPGPDGVADDETWTFSDSSAGTNTTLTQGDNYTVPFTTSDGHANGTYNFTNVDGYDTVSGGTEDDKLFANYTELEAADAENFIDDSINAFDVMPGLLEVIVVFGFVAVLIGLLFFAMRRMGLGLGRSRGL